MHENAFAKIVERIHEQDSRYDPETYFFVREALDYTSRTLKKPAQGDRRHVTGQELLEGIRAYAIQEYGPLALTVLTAWGVKHTEDFGNIVFNLVQSGVLGKTDRDQRDDFTNGYDFHDAFTKPYLPKNPLNRDLSGKAFSHGRSR